MNAPFHDGGVADEHRGCRVDGNLTLCLSTLFPVACDDLEAFRLQTRGSVGCSDLRGHDCQLHDSAKCIE